MEKINYAHAHGHLDGALTGYRLMRDMRKKGLHIGCWDLEKEIEVYLDKVINDIKEEVHKAAHEVYLAQGM